MSTPEERLESGVGADARQVKQLQVLLAGLAGFDATNRERVVRLASELIDAVEGSGRGKLTVDDLDHLAGVGREYVPSREALIMFTPPEDMDDD